MSLGFASAHADIEAILADVHPHVSLRVALCEIYAYYSRNEAMLANVLRDAPLDPVAQETMVSFYQYWETVRDAIADAVGASGEHREALLAAIALALDFQTWRTLVRQQGLDDDRAVGLMVGMVRCLGGTQVRPVDFREHQPSTRLDE